MCRCRQPFSAPLRLRGRLQYHTNRPAPQAALTTKDRGKWGTARALINLRKVDVLQVAVTSIKLSWDPSPTRPFLTVGYTICMQEVGKTGFMPVVQDTMKPHTTYCAIKLKPETVYRFMIISLAQSPLDSK